MASEPPSVVILAGPNGAGKSTAAHLLVRDAFGIDEFVNADDIARGLSGFAPQRAAFAAGRLMLRRMRTLARRRANFAFETTLASRTFAPWLTSLAGSGYRIGLLFLYIPDPRVCIERVRQRVIEGGHDVPEPVILRRHARGLSNLFELYLPLAEDWAIYDNAADAPRLIADGSHNAAGTIHDARAWQTMQEPA